MPSLAFKEWNVIVEALGAGEQLLILRKGGIAEGRGGFQVKADAFWLWPTHFHAQAEKTKPEAAKWFSAPPSVPVSEFTLRFFARVERARFLTDWTEIAALDPHHLWTEQTVRERFEWSKPAGLHAIAVRVYRAETALRFPLTPESAGCKSWVEVPGAGVPAGTPVLTDASFAEKLSRLKL